ncbi:CD276 antigen-like [Etheostoma cragini]|uniref:CD276 antigen-like n=1 Tax=Etheostoma cragini TaxID=417921 RepID=UPI00155E56B5|nr:CD276 antigen-like [Etheostoma cragini]
MASHCNTQYFLNPRLSFRLLALVGTLTWHFLVTEGAGPIELRGEVGGSVTFSCPVAKQKLKFVYFQRGEIFVNGYYESKNTTQLAWKNTRVDDDKTTMHMYHLNISHHGEYQCHFQYSDNSGAQKQVIHLSLTANYSKPALSVHCSDDNHRYSCLVTCASHYGYPSKKVKWNEPAIQMWKVLNSSEISDPKTMMVNSSSTAYFNCSNGKTSVRCSVGDVSSDMVSICSPRDPPPVFHNLVIIAILATMGISIILILLLYWRCKKGQRGAAAVDFMLIHGDVRKCEEEATVHNEKNEATEAS